MRFARFFVLVSVAASAVCTVRAVRAEGVPVGGSTLIGALDYSDTYTAYEFGGLEDRDGTNGFNLGAVDSPADGVAGEGLAVENCYGNAPRAWSDWKFSISKDANPINGNTVYPGGSGAGSATGMTQTGIAPGYGVDWGIEYGLRDRFVVQYDAVQSLDRIDIGVGLARDTIWDASNVTVFFRRDGSTSFPEIGVFNSTVGEWNTGLASPIQAVPSWHNYAAAFDVRSRTIEVFVDEVSLGVIDLDTLGDGAFAGVPLYNDVVNVGLSTYQTTTDRLWTDNFQIGSFVPEPGLMAICLSGLAGLGAFGRRRRV